MRHVKDTGKHFFACKSVMSLDKNTGFLRLRLPVLLQQNLRCKVWDDTAKIRYIALFAISEQRLKLTAFHNSAHSEDVILNTGLIRSTSTTSIPHAHIGQ